MYDEFANNEEHRLDEREAWLELGEFNGASDLDHADLMRLQGLISGDGIARRTSPATR